MFRIFFPLLSVLPSVGSVPGRVKRKRREGTAPRSLHAWQIGGILYFITNSGDMPTDESEEMSGGSEVSLIDSKM